MSTGRIIGTAVALVGAVFCSAWIFHPKAVRDWARGFWQTRPGAFWSRENLHMLSGEHYLLLSRVVGALTGAVFLFFAFVIATAT